MRISTMTGEEQEKETEKISSIFAKATMDRVRNQIKDKQWERYRGNVSQYVVDAVLAKLEIDEGKYDLT